MHDRNCCSRWSITVSHRMASCYAATYTNVSCAGHRSYTTATITLHWIHHGDQHFISKPNFCLSPLNSHVVHTVWDGTAHTLNIWHEKKLTLKHHYLDSFFLELDFNSELLAKHHVRIMSFVERSFQLFQLVLGEDCSMSSLALLHWSLLLWMHGAWCWRWCARQDTLMTDRPTCYCLLQA